LRGHVSGSNQVLDDENLDDLDDGVAAIDLLRLT
jgi:hypothetical protein